MARNTVIMPDSKIGRRWGFTSRRFAIGSWLWLRGSTIRIAAVEVKGKGNGVFSALLRGIEREGFKIQIMNPCSNVIKIGVRKGFILRERRITDLDGSRILVDVLEKGEKGDGNNKRRK